MNTEEINTLVVSDIHLGTCVSQKDKFLKVLDLNFKTLIINGDLFDNYSFHRYDKKDWKILSKIRKLTKTHNVVLVHGNHDEDCEFITGVTGMHFVENYYMKINNRSFYLEHGHQYDKWTSERPLITWFFTGLYYWFQKFDPSHTLTRHIKRLSKSWIRAKDIVRSKFVLKHQKTAEILIAGHTHYPEIRHFAKCTYINTGSFCDEVCSYCIIDDYGDFELVYI